MIDKEVMRIGICVKFQAEVATRGVLWKNLFLKILQYSQENTCNFIKKQTPGQVISCEYWKIFKSTYFEEHLRTAASVHDNIKIYYWL